jgi:PKHD-type hydroxylase
MLPIIYGDFLTDLECASIIGLGDEFKEGKTTDAPEEWRNSQVLWLWPEDLPDWFRDKMAHALAKTAVHYDFAIEGFKEPLQLSKYQEGGYYDFHMDLGEEKRTRKLSFVIPLNDDYEGGELAFPANQVILNNEHKGSCIAFPSFIAHGVKPVTKGDRYSLVAWAHGPEFR